MEERSDPSFEPVRPDEVTERFASDGTSPQGHHAGLLCECLRPRR
jgi:hypothetical protein